MGMKITKRVRHGYIWNFDNVKTKGMIESDLLATLIKSYKGSHSVKLEDGEVTSFLDFVQVYYSGFYKKYKLLFNKR